MPGKRIDADLDLKKLTDCYAFSAFDLATREPTGHTATHSRQELQFDSASGMPLNVVTMVEMPLNAKSSIPVPFF